MKVIINRWDKLLQSLGYDSSNIKDEITAFGILEKVVQPYRTKKEVEFSLITWMSLKFCMCLYSCMTHYLNHFILHGSNFSSFAFTDYFIRS